MVLHVDAALSWSGGRGSFTPARFGSAGSSRRRLETLALAGDLLHDNVTEAFRCCDQLGEIEHPEAWLFGIARNRALAAVRRRRRFRAAFERLVHGLSRAREMTSSCWRCETCWSALSNLMNGRS